MIPSGELTAPEGEADSSGLVVSSSRRLLLLHPAVSGALALAWICRLTQASLECEWWG